MAKQPSSFADHILDWEGLIMAFDEHADLLAPAAPQRQALEEVLDEAKEIKARQDSHIGAKQRATQEIRLVKPAGREAARRLRRAIAATVGTDNELLTQFKITPIRPRTKKKQAGGAPSPQPPTETPPEEPPQVE